MIYCFWGAGLIKNTDLLTAKTGRFSLGDFKYIVGFFLSYQTELSEKTSLLDIDFIYEDDNNHYIIRLRFYHPEDINFESGGRYHQINFTIDDIRDCDWEDKNYKVFDYEEDTLRFYCTQIEVISVQVTVYIIKPC